MKHRTSLRVRAATAVAAALAVSSAPIAVTAVATAVTGSPCSGFCSGGGPIASGPSQVHLIFLSDARHHFPAKSMAVLEQFVTDWSDSGAHGVLSPYGVSNQLTLATATDGAHLPSNGLTDGFAQKEISKEARRNGWAEGNPSDQFVVLVPPGEQWVPPHAGDCGWHGEYNETKNSPSIFYAVVGDPQTGPNGAPTACIPAGLTGPFPHGEDIDLAVSALSHELAEMESDPWGNKDPGWYNNDFAATDTGGYEVADLCWVEHVSLATAFPGHTDSLDGRDITLHGRGYLIQSLWSGIGQVGGCSLDAPLSVTSTSIWLTANQGAEGNPYSLPGVSFTDPDGESTAANYQAVVSWGDGTTTSETVTGSVLNGVGTYAIDGSHSYVQDGTYQVSVQIADVAGAEGPTGASSVLHLEADVILPVANGGGGWSVATAALPPDALDLSSANLTGMSCDPGGSCHAVGQYGTTAGAQHGLIETLSNGTWSAQSAPVPATGSNYVVLNSVSCPSAASCVAVGIYDDSQGAQQGLIETLSSGIWTATTAPVPAISGTPFVELNSVSCTEDGGCVAVGEYSNQYGIGGGGLIEMLSGSSWAPIEAGGALDSVSCVSASACVAVGNALIESLSAGVWAASTAPLPPNGSGLGLQQVSCGGTGSCAAWGPTRRQGRAFSSG
jgi:hypothetical protein